MPELPPLREIIAAHGLSARKSLGQNFLLDLNLTGRIARSAAPLSDCTVVEVGPGPGGLTRALLDEGAAQVVAIERDDRCIAALEELSSHYPGRLQIVAGDALKTNLSTLVDGPAKIVANLPYNISTALLTRWLATKPWPPWYISLTLMFQKEVAERITAPPESKTYGRLSVLAAATAEAACLFDVNPSAFTPPPKVTSTIVQLVPRSQILLNCSVATLEKVTAAAFGQRRKMVRQSLKSLGTAPEVLLECAGLSPTMRAEEITPEGFCRLANCLDGDPS
ncbi:MAG: 16S rRNA (adenine(1518)-N(6)/adenine(1519)-N(6))-dimethyltransferase RsmA [Alphaproteobacteria bacterium]|nr:16S rRNA (adenine(1518)-N(6)/adenine(1519)-N(6))-dimethyltransferase RsmA [Alphaproteobacteria bacterium]